MARYQTYATAGSILGCARQPESSTVTLEQKNPGHLRQAGTAGAIRSAVSAARAYTCYQLQCSTRIEGKLDVLSGQEQRTSCVKGLTVRPAGEAEIGVAVGLGGRKLQSSRITRAATAAAPSPSRLLAVCIGVPTDSQDGCRTVPATTDFTVESSSTALWTAIRPTRTLPHHPAMFREYQHTSIRLMRAA